MPREIFYVIFNTAIGWAGIFGTAKGVLNVILPRKSEQDIICILGPKMNEAKLSRGRFKDIIERLKTYFDGYEVEFCDKLDLSGATRFQSEVWHVVKSIPYGETRSYSWVAERVNKPKATRAVGQALSKNPLPVIIPCHRVVAKDGGIGGFSGGLDMKRYLLRLEKESRIDLLKPEN